jgi:hypothetical protein
VKTTLLLKIKILAIYRHKRKEYVHYLGKIPVICRTDLNDERVAKKDERTVRLGLDGS